MDTPRRSPSMRALLAADPFLPRETQAAIANREASARDELLALGVNECEARELLDEAPADCCF